MKKFISFFCSCLLVVLSFGLGGCTSQTTSSLSYTLEYNVNRLSNILNETNEATTSDLVIPDIYSENENVNARNISKKQYTSNSNVPEMTRQVVTEEELNNKNSSEISNTLLKNSNYKTYTPRRISNINYKNSSYNSYLGKVEDLYIMVSDAVCANDSICNCKNNILAYCEFLIDIANKLKSNEIEVSNDQINSCNGLLKELGKCTNNLSETKNDVSNNCKGLSQKKSLSNGIDALSSKYVTLVNCLDNRLTDYQNVLAILAQLQCVLNGNCSSDSNSFNALSDILSNNTADNEVCDNGNCNKECYTDENGKTYCYENNENNCNYNGNCPSNNFEQTSSKKPISDKISDYGTKNAENEGKIERKNNIDTFKNKTVNPNIIKKENINNNTTNESQEQTQENFNYGNQQNNRNLPNNVNSYGNGNGVYGVPINNYVPNTYGNGAYGNGAYNGIYGNGFHTYENGVTNPYRNTDTYKFPPQQITNYGINGFPNIKTETNFEEIEKPIPSETRKNFKGFEKFESNFEAENSTDKVENNKIDEAIIEEGSITKGSLS